MTEAKFIETNEPRWRELHQMTSALRKTSIKKMTTNKVREFARSFRNASMHLAYAKTHYPNGRAAPYLNQLVGAAHMYFFRTRKSAFGTVMDYLRSGFAKALRQQKSYIIAAFIIFMVGVAVAVSMVLVNKEFAALFLPVEYLEAANGFNESAGEAGSLSQAFMSSAVMTNNISVSFMSFALGITAGLGTIYVMFLNGGMLGALSALVFSTGGSAAHFFALILPHGFIELTAIYIAGGCGLLIGRAMLIPGNLKRKDAVILAGKQAAALLPGVVIMLVIAGIIEGFFTPANIAPWIKLAFSFGTIALMVVYYRLALKN
ncbi:MAG: stage II sporulation protein M [Clostridiales bacterium]|jgi:uncharacterized membrane protein SpoIIM required for sporulation|nr:stage II sporulation protein M [Clostridiales bacterium]